MSASGARPRHLSQAIPLGGMEESSPSARNATMVPVNPSHGADFDMCNLPEKRSRRSPSSFGVASLPEPDHRMPECVAPGYTECVRASCLTRSANGCVSRRLLICGWVRTASFSTWAVVQARLRAHVRKSIGIEYVYVRCGEAASNGVYFCARAQKCIS